MKSELIDLNKKLRVLYIADPVEVGGASKSLIDIVTAMAERGIECVVCTSSHGIIEKTLEKVNISCIVDGHMAAMEVPPNSKLKRIPIYILRKYQYKRALKKAIKIISRKEDLSKFDLIHTNSARNDLGCELARKYSLPHIMHIREFGDEDFGCWTYRKKYVSYLNNNTNQFICISNAIKRSWSQKGINLSKMHVIYNGVDDTKILSINSIEKFKNEYLNIVLVGGVCAAKGQIDAIKALEFVPKNIQEKLHLDIIGWGDKTYIRELEDEVSEANLSERVSFLGAKDDIDKRLCHYQIGLMCSRAEGFGRVTVEYMHAGLGVIASRAGANEEIITDDETGLLYVKDDPQALAEKIVEYYLDRDKLINCARNGQRWVKKYFTKKINADNIYNFYINVMTEKRR